MDLQQDMVNFNKRMLIANTVINGVQAAVSLTSAAAGLGKAIYERKAMQAQNAQRANIEYLGSSQIDAVNAGYVPYETFTDDNGEVRQRYVGFDSYTTRDGRTIGQIKEEIKQAYGKDGGFFNTDYFGNMAFKELEIGLRENELRAQRALQQREHELNVQLRNDNMNKLVSRYALGEQHFDEEGNEVPIETVVMNELNRYPMSPEEREVEARKWTEKVHYERTLYDAMNTVTQEGFDAAVREVDAMKESGLIDDASRKKIIAEIAHEDDILKRATEDQIQKQIEANKTANNGNPLAICTEKDQMKQRGMESGNPREQRQWEEAALRNQQGRLDARFHEDYVTAQSRGLAEAKRQREKYVRDGRYQADYDEQSETQDRHLRQWDSLIDEMEREARQREGSGQGRSARNIIQNCVEEFHRNNMDGPIAIETINGIRHEEPALAADAIDEIFGLDPRKWNQRASTEYRNLTAMIDEMRPPTSRPEERTIYDAESRQLERAVQQAYYRNVTADDMAELIRTHRSALANERLSTVFGRGDIGSSGPAILPGIQASEGATAFVHYSNRGGMDLRYSEQSVDPNNPRRTIPLTVGGDRAENVMRQTANENRTWANDQLRGTGITLNEYSPENAVRDERGDRDGVIHYTGNDGRTYRVDATDPNRPGSRILEVKVGNEWQRVDIRELRRNGRNQPDVDRGTTTPTRPPLPPPTRPQLSPPTDTRRINHG
jgi:hypothetical protein